MRSLHVPMTWEEWERLPWRFGWKHEYSDGHAHLTPRQDHVHVRVEPRPRPELRVAAGSGAACLFVRPVGPADAQGLAEAFIEAFEDGVEFCDWPAKGIHEHARRNIADYFARRRGTPLLSASRLALVSPPGSALCSGEGKPGGEGGYIVGAALLSEREAGPTLDLLMVRPGFRRRGIAGALVGAAVDELHAQGATVLRSAHCVANEESALWHRAFGFEEEPDLHFARLRRVFFLHEMSRYEGLDTAQARREHARLESLYEFWSRRTEELEEVAEREGFEAVMPALRYGR